MQTLPNSAEKTPLPTSRFRPGKKAFLVVGLSVAVSAASLALSSRPGRLGSSGGSVEAGELALAPVKRGPFRVAVTDQGNLDSMNNVTLKSKVDGRTTIIHLVPEGTKVEEGELVCELDSSVLIEDLTEDKLQLTEARAALEQAEKSLEIQKRQNESDIAAAKLAWELAELDYEKYTAEDGEYNQLRSQAAGELELAREELQRAQETLDFTQRLAKKGYRTQQEVEAERVAVRKAELEVDAAEKKLNVLTEYTRKRQQAELEANAKELKQEWERTKLQAQAAAAQARAEVEKQKLQVKVREEDYNEERAQLEACKMYAPQSGTVVYANDSGRRRSEMIIEEGAEVRERQEIIKIPDLTRMKVEAKVHESKIAMVDTGLPVLVRVDAFPDKVYHGEVNSVASVPSSTNWFNGDLKEYKVEIRITDEDPEKISRLRPGLTAGVEIVVEDREGVLQVPVQAVVTIGEKQYAYAFTEEGPERRTLMLGSTNDEFTEVLDGVEEGEQVVINPRSSFSEGIAQLEAAQSEQENEEPEQKDAPASKSDAPGGKGEDRERKSGGETPQQPESPTAKDDLPQNKAAERKSSQGDPQAG